MKIFNVENKQNIYDIAIQLFGTVEGVFDLMANNPELSYDTELNSGDVLYWNESSVIFQTIVDDIDSSKLIPRNGERKVYYKNTDERVRCKIKIPSDSMSITLVVSGNNNMTIDWGDNTGLETIELQPTENKYIHYFDNQSLSRVITLYGEFEIKSWNLSDISGDIYPVNPIVVDEVVSSKNNISLQCLFLFKGTYNVELSNMIIRSLDCIRDMSLSDLKLTKITYTNNRCLDDYLIYIAKNNNQRRNCHVILDEKPSGEYKEPPKDENGNYIITTGMQAIYVIVNELSWNEAGPWIFEINDVIYSAENKL